MQISVLLPHLKKYGGIKRYIHFGNELLKNFNDVTYTLLVTDLKTDEEQWIRNELDFKGNVEGVSPNHKTDILFCGDAYSLPLFEKLDAHLKVVNVIFPPIGSTPEAIYLLGDYKDTLYNRDYIVAGNGTGWEGVLDKQPNWYTAPGGYDPTLFYPVDRPLNKKLRVLFMAKDRPWKGQDKILQIFEATKNSWDWGCFDTERHDNYPSEIEQHIDLPQSAMKDLYSQYDVFLSCETLAGWQNTCAEAMACGCLVVSTPIGTRDFLINGKTGVVINIDDTTEQIVEKIVSKLSKIKSITKAGLKKIKEFTWKNYAINWHNLLTTKLEGVKEEMAKQTKQMKIAEEMQQALAKADSIAEMVSSMTTKRASDVLSGVNLSAQEIKSNLPRLETQESKAKDLIMQGIQEKADILKAYLKKDIITFDKYESLGAYHWASTDPIYLRYVEMVSAIFKHIKEFFGTEGNDVLDVGGGDGFITSKIAEHGFNVELIDTNETAVTLAKAKLKEFPNASVSTKNFFQLEKAPSIVLLSQVIEHFEDPDVVLDKLLELKPNFLIISTPIAKTDGTMWDLKYHYAEYSIEDMKQMLGRFTKDYMVRKIVDEPYNQIFTLESKRYVLSKYITDIIDEEVLALSDNDVSPAVESIMNITSNEILEG